MAFFLRSLKFAKIHLRFALVNIIARVKCYEFCANFFAPRRNSTRLATKGKVTRKIFRAIRSAGIGKSQGTWTMVRVDKTEIQSATPTPLDDELKFSWNTDSYQRRNLFCESKLVGCVFFFFSFTRDFRNTGGSSSTRSQQRHSFFAWRLECRNSAWKRCRRNW